MIFFSDLWTDFSAGGLNPKTYSSTMIFTRKIGAILRGKATSFQLIAGCVLGAMLGFLPGFSAAPGLTVLLALLLVLLNANLLLAAVVGAVAKLLSWLLLPLSFELGRLLLDGPTEPLFRRMVNTPVLALLGVENYTATGGLVLGVLFGGLTGWLVARGVKSFRLRMAKAGETSEKLKAWNQRRWVRWSVCLLAGGGLKSPDYAALATKKIGNPIRPLGAAFVVFSTVLIVVGTKFFASDIVTNALREGLETANGATVELESAELDLGAGKLVVTGLAVADPNALGTNLFAADRIEADVSSSDLLRKRLTIDRIVVSGGRLSEARRVPGQRVEGAPEARFGIPLPDAESIEGYLANAQLWRERLAQVKSWLDRLSSPSPDAAPASDAPAEETWSERLERLAQERGYAALIAERLISDSPTLMVSEFEADSVRASWLPEETLTIRGHNLSTQPWLSDAIAAVEVNSSKDTLGFTVKTGAESQVTAHYRGIPAARITEALKKPLLEGGTVDLALAGTYSTIDGTINVPLDVTLHDTTVQVAGRAVPLDNFTLPVGLSGPLDSPRIKVDADQLGRIAKEAGTQLLKDKASEALGDKAGGLLKGLLGGGKKEP